MSWDLLIVTAERPAIEAPDALYTVGEPAAVEPEDLPEALAAVAEAARFLVELSVPAAATSADRARAMARARALAERGGGAIYDPQEDVVVWPEVAAVARAPEQRIRVVELTWYVRGRDFPDAMTRSFLDGVRAGCPEALPRRYGDTEPFQHRLEAGGEEALVARWRDAAAVEHGGWLFWSARSPCFAGSVSFPDKRGAFPSGITGTRRCAKLSLSFDGRVLDADPRACEAVVALVPAVARAIGAFYAAAHVVRDVIARRALGYDQRTESVSMPHAWFAGLPPTPTWLAWFGPAYAPLVAATFGDRAAPAPDGARWFRGGPTPMDADQLTGVFPPLPPALCFRPRDDGPPGTPRIVVAPQIPLR